MKLLPHTPQPVHPNRLLQHDLDTRNLSPEQAAAEVGVSLDALQAVLDGGPFTPELAGALERAWGSPAVMWLRMQARYDTHPGPAGKRSSTGRPASSKVVANVRVAGSPEEIEQIKAWIAAQGRKNRAQVTAAALLAGIRGKMP